VIADTLKKLQTEGGMGNFAIFKADEKKNYYIQFSGAKGEPSLYAEAVSNDFLQPENKISNEKSQVLLKKGWKSEQGRNYQKIFPANTDEERKNIEEEILILFRDVYDVENTCKIEEEIIFQ
jgi:hypothetical protein